MAQVLQDEHVSASGKEIGEIAAAARELMNKRRICLIRGFPVDPGRFLAFLSEFGTPLANYASLSDLEKEDPHPQINKVKYKRKDNSARESVHHIAGGLR